MWKTGIILIVLLGAIKHAETVNSDACTEKPPDATAAQQSFYITKSKDKIGKDVTCTWTISAPKDQKIMVYMSVEQDPKEHQCVTVSNKPGEAGTQLCQKINKNTFESTGHEVTVTYPANNVDEGVPDFKVMYKTANNQQCTEAPKEANAFEQSFAISKDANTIAKDVQCSWTITAPKEQKITVYLDVNADTKEQQCVTVSNTAEGNGAKLCQTANANTFNSTGPEVTVTYTANNVEGGVPNFKVMYKTANNQYCTGAPPEATDGEQSFYISQNPDTIAKDVQCSWIIRAPKEQKIMVYLDVNADTKEQQCVTVSNNAGEGGTKLCQKANGNTFTSTGSQVTVTYIAHTVVAGVSNFKVMYRIAQAENSADCTTDVKAPTETEQSFNITKMETIAKGVTCKWELKATSQQKVQVYLEVNANTKDEQCVTVSNTAEQGGEKLCQKENKNNFISTGSDVIVTYSAHSLDAGVPNFKVMYKTAGARALVPWNAILSVTYVLSQMFQLL